MEIKGGEGGDRWRWRPGGRWRWREMEVKGDGSEGRWKRREVEVRGGTFHYR